MDGHKVVVELTSYGGEHMKPEGKVVQIIGHINDPGTDILSVVMDSGIPAEFPEKVLNQAVRVGKPVSEADCAGRKDLRDWMMVTIDGEDAKDLDDAVSLQMDGEIIPSACILRTSRIMCRRTVRWTVRLLSGGQACTLRTG